MMIVGDLSLRVVFVVTVEMYSMGKRRSVIKGSCDTGYESGEWQA